jgi:hypothetical protein
MVQTEHIAEVADWTSRSGRLALRRFLEGQTSCPRFDLVIEPALNDKVKQVTIRMTGAPLLIALW